MYLVVEKTTLFLEKEEAEGSLVHKLCEFKKN
jgi:hypothetical protein